MHLTGSSTNEQIVAFKFSLRAHGRQCNAMTTDSLWFKLKQSTDIKHLDMRLSRAVLQHASCLKEEEEERKGKKKSSGAENKGGKAAITCSAMIVHT